MSKAKVKAGMVFERHEKKFVVESAKFPVLMQALDPYLEQDQYGLHTICSLYYDTDRFDIIRKSLDKPKFKVKLRLRSYGVPGEGDTVYLELKKKLDGITYKRRIGLPLSAARSYLQRGIRPGGVNPQILGEIDWFLRENAPAPKVLLSYDRIAMAGREDPDLRVTFDADIRWRDTNVDLANGDYGSPLLPGGRLMEIKTLSSFPLWLCDILSRLEIYPQSYSKYGTVYQDYLMSNKKEAFRYAG